MYSLIVKGDFAAAHMLPAHPHCGVVHGHAFQVEVKVSGSDINNDGMLVDFQDIKALWKCYDHTFLNDFFDHPTAENIAQAIFNGLKKMGVKVDYVRVWESPDACCEVS